MPDIEGLNNREIAIAIWLGVALLASLFKNSIRTSYKDLLGSFFNRKVFGIYLLSVGYTCIAIFLLYRIHGWTIHELKGTVLWCTYTIMKTLMNVKNIEKDKLFFKKAVRENLKFAVIVEFISEAYTFGLAAELILIPLLVLFGGTLSVAGKEAKYETIRKLLNFLITAFVLATIGHSFYQVILHFKQFASLEKLREFILSPLLALWFLPWLFFLSLYMRFEAAFIMLQFQLQEPDLRAIAKRKAFFGFFFNIKGLERWKMSLNFYKPQNAHDIDISIAQIKALQKTEKNPPRIDPSQGWSPYSAKDFLISMGLETRYYQNVYGDEWSASSSYKQLGTDILANNISYYIFGTSHAATELKLCLTVTYPQYEKQALAFFNDAAYLLYMRATNKVLPNKFAEHIRKKKNFTLTSPPLEITLHKDNYDNQLKQYSNTFSIKLTVNAS